jgi:hypothetical protein
MQIKVVCLIFFAVTLRLDETNNRARTKLISSLRIVANPTFGWVSKIVS